MKFFKINFLTLITFICLFILILSLRGESGNPKSQELLSSKWQFDGPFELSPERGRFALLYSIIEDRSLYFSENIAKFANPDVAVYDGNFVSLFAPLLSFIVIPGYLSGKIFGISQVGTFFVISIFALINFLLIRNIAIKLGAHQISATIAALIFLFATPAFAYAVNLYQHHVSTFLILISLYASLKFRNWISAFIVFFATGVAIPLDYPNLFFFLPIAIYIFFKSFFLEKIRSKIVIKISLLKVLSPVIMIIPISFFLWFNNASYGSPFQLSGTLPTSKKVLNIESLSKKDITSQVEESRRRSLKEGKTKSALNFFKTRLLLNGFYIHFVSPDRGIIYYAPVILFGIVGFILAYKNKVRLSSLLVSIIGANILLYSMWGDPWGGWAFGSRYLIPSYAILSIFVALFLTYLRKRIVFLAIFSLIAFYSIAVNTLGALTTSAMPPKVEILELERISGVPQKYTFERNWDVLISGNSKSFVYNKFFKNYFNPVIYYQIIIILIFIVTGGLIFIYVISWRKDWYG